VPWNSVHVFHCPTRLSYGRGAARELGERLRELGVTRALIVSDPGLEAAGTVATMRSVVEEAGLGVEVYARTQPNPTAQNVHEAAALFRETGCDGLVGLGGGSSLDCAKGAGIVVANGGRIVDYRGPDKVPARIPPLVCVPTTCGTGSEVTTVAVITDPEVDFKVVIVSPRIAPDAGLVDPDLVQSAPPAVIASTGIDALAHAVESLVNLGSDPLLAALDLAAIRLIGANLRRAVAERDPDALAQVMLASMIAGVAFNMNGNAIVHAASTPVTAHHHVPHGVANGIFLPAGLEVIAPGCAVELAQAAEALGEDVSGLAPEQAAARAIAAIRSLCADIGIPATLRDWGLDPAQVDIPRLVEDAMKSRNIPTNPVPVGPEELAGLYAVVVG
jgi:alcohol dehydrogenase class IV